MLIGSKKVVKSMLCCRWINSRCVNAELNVSSCMDWRAGTQVFIRDIPSHRNKKTDDTLDLSHILMWRAAEGTPLRYLSNGIA